MTRDLLIAFTLLSAPDLATGQEQTIGLLEVPDIFGRTRCEPTLKASVPLYRSPSTTAKIGELRAAPSQPEPGGNDWQCDREVRLFLGKGNGLELVALEHDYEMESLVVTAVARGWYRIRTGGKPASGWLRATPRVVYRPLHDLYKDALTSLTASWDGRLYSSPYGGYRVLQGAAPGEFWGPTVRINELTVIDDVYWARVTFIDGCDDVAVEPGGRGWVRVHRPDSSRAVMLWFASRGC